MFGVCIHINVFLRNETNKDKKLETHLEVRGQFLGQTLFHLDKMFSYGHLISSLFYCYSATVVVLNLRYVVTIQIDYVLMI